MNQIEINKIDPEKEQWVIHIPDATFSSYACKAWLTPSQMKELKEKIAKLDL